MSLILTNQVKYCFNHLQLLSYFCEKDREKRLFSNAAATTFKNINYCVLCEKFLAAPIGEVDDMDMTPFMLACERSNLDIMFFLIKCGVAFHENISQKCTALHVAARYKNIDVLEVLVQKTTNIDALDEFGFTPLFWACQGNKLNAMEFLVNRGASINIKSKENWNILHMAAICADNEIIDYLLAHKVSLTDVDNKDRTPLSLNCILSQMKRQMLSTRPI